MGTISRDKAVFQHDWNDDSWTSGTPTTAAETLSGTTESLTGTIDCESYWSVQITVDIDHNASPTDEVEIHLYGGAVSGAMDDLPFAVQIADHDVDPCQLTILVPDPPAYLRVGFVQTGSTDSHEISSVHVVGFTGVTA